MLTTHAHDNAAMAKRLPAESLERLINETNLCGAFETGIIEENALGLTQFQAEKLRAKVSGD
jgi:hypothetical protein